MALYTCHGSFGVWLIHQPSFNLEHSCAKRVQLVHVTACISTYSLGVWLLLDVSLPMSVITDGYKELVTLDQEQASKVIIFGMVQFYIFFCKSKPFFYQTKQDFLISVIKQSCESHSYPLASLCISY